MLSENLTDDHILELSGNITNINDLHKLGVTVLGLKLKQVNSVHTDSRGINDAASKLLQIWTRKQKSQQEAFNTLCTELRQVGWSQFAYELENKRTPASQQAYYTSQPKRKYLTRKSFLLLLFGILLFTVGTIVVFDMWTFQLESDGSQPHLRSQEKAVHSLIPSSKGIDLTPQRRKSYFFSLVQIIA